MKIMSETAMYEQLQAFVNICMAILAEEGATTYSSMASRTGLSSTTMFNLYNTNYTIRIQVRTLQKLGAAVGLVIELSETTVSMKTVKRVGKRGSKLRAA